MQILAGPPSPAQPDSGASTLPPARSVVPHEDRSPARAHDPAREVGFDQRLGAQVPLDARFLDENSRPVTLGALVRERPAVLVMTYYECPNLCTIVLNGLVAGLRQVSFDAGRQFEVITVSISPRDTPQLARAKKAAYLRSYDRAGAASGWHFLTGAPAQVDRLARSIGFRYFYDDKSQQYAHAAGLVLLTPGGRIARYVPGVAFPAQELRLGLVEASAQHIGTLTDRLWLLCYHYDPATGRYSLLVQSILRLGGVLMIVALGGLVALLLLRERRRRAGPSSR
jgi:protein SCO1/2